MVTVCWKLVLFCYTLNTYSHTTFFGFPTLNYCYNLCRICERSCIGAFYIKDWIYKLSCLVPTQMFFETFKIALNICWSCSFNRALVSTCNRWSHRIRCYRMLQPLTGLVKIWYSDCKLIFLITHTIQVCTITNCLFHFNLEVYFTSALSWPARNKSTDI